MKTTVEIPGAELVDVIRFTNAKTKRAAVDPGIRRAGEHLAFGAERQPGGGEQRARFERSETGVHLPRCGIRGRQDAVRGGGHVVKPRGNAAASGSPRPQGKTINYPRSGMITNRGQAGGHRVSVRDLARPVARRRGRLETRHVGPRSLKRPARTGSTSAPYPAYWPIPAERFGAKGLVSPQDHGWMRLHAFKPATASRWASRKVQVPFAAHAHRHGEGRRKRSRRPSPPSDASIP